MGLQLDDYIILPPHNFINCSNCLHRQTPLLLVLHYSLVLNVTNFSKVLHACSMEFIVGVDALASYYKSFTNWYERVVM